MQIAQHWPQRFHQLLEEYTLPISSNTASLRVYLREMHQALYRLLVHPELLFVREEFERYIHARWPDKLILQQDLRQTHPIISLAKAAEQLNLSRGAVHKLIESGTLKGCQSSSAKGKTIWMVERSSLDAYARSEHGTLTISEVERMLRITPKRIRLLIESGLLQPLPTIRNVLDGAFSWKLSTPSWNN
ncbi:helix-turn-helix domain-containing protein [Chromobacterium vaccinii]|uniref:helix-turn-helix domain-containing protein n=1 Tax=Chromobacterium vaccinii TaxID=1108595 RepID=UPI000E15FE75|nr:helix-turn-helix domain-containing protein [Chromobacterium vaccinii]SUX54267.1 Helix-turn-helix domain [Chromobacterium vaccinii]